ncbi:GAF domain-containing sensor histidine kinase [Streptomyces radicis]|uniref:GAF domain-containing protein n=1 Tax=Streptomyces radicis TaxID=1750517 RepID=A0A3A9W3C6_9ACTN|nr:GAF domain-containing sensor histidine kinase [Streptomyces radicis]RKN07252.1 GAF domain-containing protein [Streptomyces radicis]RKN26731.1 GAF domain-containing protein [Streptomyces radicis]
MRQMPRLLKAMESLGADQETDPDPEHVLTRIVRTAAELTDAPYAALAVLNETGDGLAHLITHAAGPGRPPEVTRLARALCDGGRPASGPPGTLCVPVLAHGATFGALQVATGAPDAAFTSDDRALLRFLANEAGIAIGTARLLEAVRQQARWMDGSLELSTSLLAADEDNALAVVAEQARRLAGAAEAAVLEPDRNGGLEVVAASGAAAPRLLRTTLPPDDPAALRVMGGEPVFVDAPAHMLLPLASDGAALGALSLTRAPGSPPYSVPERALATQFAQQAALALVLATARRDREQLAVFEDRDRIARDLHDLVIQRLFAIGLTLESAGRRVPPDSADVRDRIDAATGELDATVEEIRTAIFGLHQHPEHPDDRPPTGLRARVLRETSTAAATLGFRPSATFTGPVDSAVGEETARHLVAALREGLSNVARHAGASRVEVAVDATARLADGTRAVRLTVADDGVGVPEGDSRRSGLRNIRERAEALGGFAVLGPGLGGRGTELTWQAPR